MPDLETSYEAAHNRLQAAIETLQAMIHDMPAPGGDARYNWGHVGTVNNIASQIEELAQ